jgi:hypothetical protein
VADGRVDPIVVADEPVGDGGVEETRFGRLRSWRDARLRGEGVPHPADVFHGNALRVAIALLKFCFSSWVWAGEGWVIRSSPSSPCMPTTMVASRFSHLINLNSGQCGAIQGGSTAWGARVIQRPCGTWADYYWYLDYVYYPIG